jgi:hypothetical protein
VILAVGVNAGQGDPERLAEVIHLRAIVAEAEQSAVDGMRANGITWKSIGAVLGVTGEAMIARYGHPGNRGRFGPTDH